MDTVTAEADVAKMTLYRNFADRCDPVRQGRVTHLANIRAFVRELGAAAGVADPEHFAGSEVGLLLLTRKGVAAPAA